MAIYLEAEGFPQREIWQQSDGSGQWQEGQVHVKAKEFFSAKAYQVHMALSCCSLHVYKNGKYVKSYIETFLLISFY